MLPLASHGRTCASWCGVVVLLIYPDLFSVPGYGLLKNGRVERKTSFQCPMVVCISKAESQYI